ncbi:MAG: class I SAM-dependent methyltransferase [Phycisphaeraceae bacterium]|nr:class I SAM-dependent methyltransferase [Phycisphaeraceae bacterium]
MPTTRPFYENVQAHYDLSDDFYSLFLDPSMTYSCAYFERDGMSLEEAQAAKVDLSLGKCDLKPGLTLLDIGCGWGSTAMRAAQRFGVKAIGLTLSKNQQSKATDRARMHGLADRVQFRLQGWEEFDDSADRIISIGAFEHFRRERFAAFFTRCRQIMARTPDARMMLHTILLGDERTLQPGETLATHEHILFAKFIQKEIFPGGQLTQRKVAEQFAQAAGFKVELVQSLRLHYARTLDCWAANLERERDRAIATTSQEVFDRYMKYLLGCARYFRSGHLDVCQFSLAV